MPTSKGASKQTKPKMHFATAYTLLKPKQTAAGFFFMTKTKIIWISRSTCRIGQQKLLPPFCQGSSVKSEL